MFQTYLNNSPDVNVTSLNGVSLKPFTEGLNLFGMGNTIEAYTSEYGVLSHEPMTDLIKYYLCKNTDNFYGEKWLPLVGYKTKHNYFISNLGRIKNSSGNILATRPDRKRGYIGIPLQHENGINSVHVTMHRAVAFAFIPNPENKPEVNHINALTWDNRLKNLEWATSKENRAHAIIMGNAVFPIIKRGKDALQSKRTAQYDSFGNLIKIWDCATHAAIALGVSESCIMNAARGENPGCRGFKWKYI